MNVYIACSRVLVVMVSVAAGACSAGDGSSTGGIEASIRLSDEAVAADAGLPTYPGSKPYSDSSDARSSANMGLSTPLFGLKIVAMNLESGDRPERVARFYWDALSKFGSVLDCSDSAAASKGRHSAADEKDLVCEPNEASDQRFVYKVGTGDNHRIVAVKDHGSGTRFSLVHLDLRGEAKP